MDKCTTLQQRLYEALEKELGVAEWAEGSNPRIIAYHQCTSLRAKDQAISWCASFINFCCNQVGILGTNSAAARSFLSWGKNVDDNPQKYDLVILQRGASQASGHVGLLKCFNGEMVTLLSGNTGDQVCFANFPKSKVLGYRRATAEMYRGNLN